jgi:type I restriction enzyme S subunit
VVDGQFWVNNHAHVVRGKAGEADNRYVAYLLNSLTIAGYITGVAQPKLSQNNLRLITVRIPGIQAQERVVATLRAYDDLIENNNRRIALLEQAARLLYEEWFVRLRFPGREHTRIVDGVPRGWKRVTVSEITSFLKRGIAPQYDDDAAGLVINQKCVRDGRLNVGLARHQAREFGPDRQVQVGDVLVNSTGEGTLGRVAQVKAPVENCTVDTHVTIVRPAGVIGVHYFGLAMLAYEPLLSTMGRGATNQTELSPTQIGAVEILVPSRTLMDQFEGFAGPIYEQITNLTGQNQKSRAARDLLLPRLMSGEIAA